MPLGRPQGGNKRAEQYSNAGKFGGRPPSGSASGAASTVAMTDGTEKAQGTSGAEAQPAPFHACGAASAVDMAGGIEQAQGAAAPSAPRHAGGETSAVDMADGSTPLRLKLMEGVPLLPRIGGRARVHGGVPPAKRGRSKSEESGALVGTMYCQLLDYFLTTALQKNLALCKDDIVDMALGYLEMAVPRPIPPARVEEHVRGVFSELLKHATQRASGRPLAAGEAFDPSVHAWDAAATYEDWERAYTAAFSVPPPASILPLSILRERRAADAARVIAEAERLAASEFVGTRAPAPAGARGACGRPSSEGAVSEPGVHVYSPTRCHNNNSPTSFGGYDLAPRYPSAGGHAPLAFRAPDAPRCPLKTQSLSKKDEHVGLCNEISLNEVNGTQLPSFFVIEVRVPIQNEL